jgi:putative ATPase
MPPANDLWAGKREQARQGVMPLAMRMRPRTLEEFAGQQHILGEGKLLRRMLQADAVTSLIFHGPPGTGKTTLAELIAKQTRRHFVRENASSVGVKRIREIIDEAANRLELEGKRTILFLDEIHRFNKAQQDVLLGDVERGLITLIGATTENPLFAVNSALVSRSTLFRLEPLSEEDIKRVVRQAIADKERGYGKLPLTVTEEALDVWAKKSDGDARRALTALEVAVLSGVRGTGLPPGADEQDASVNGATQDNSSSKDAPGQPRTAEHTESRTGRKPGATIVIDRQTAEDSIQLKAAVYDATGDEHFDVISAMIKSVRGSDPDAAVYWIARMLDAGEDPRYIARRLAILASEDIGNADPRGIMIAAAGWELVERIGLPEARITLSQVATYLACAPKSNAAYLAIDEALADVKEGRTVPVPVYLKDGNVRKAAEMSAGGREGLTRSGATGQGGAAEPYKYAHDEPGGLGTQDYLGVDKQYYRPTDRGAEKVLAQMLEAARAARKKSPGP